jgi:uncharacterized membrane protein (UPF0182 family)
LSCLTQKSAEGLPNFYLKDIPSAASGGPEITEPRIYFGQSTGGYVIVKGSTPEFDYPKGKDNVYANYNGVDGIAIGGTAWRTLFAWYFDDVNILLSRYITSDSRIMLHRNIQDRVHMIASFLQLDRDPYVVISDGRVYWKQDAYTTSDWFPYAQAQSDGDTNYIRNSVKVVIDAYNGTVTFYVADATDPIVATYRRIFPTLFKPFNAMPPDLQKHIRYPEDLFTIQALQYRAYHMDAPEVFYNREDLWQFPREPTTSEGMNLGGGTRMAPYYIMMRLPAPGSPHAVICPTTANSSFTSSPRTSSSTGLSRSRRASTRTPRSRSRSRCGTRWARESFAEIFWSCRSRIRFCMCRRCIFARSRASCRNSSG